MWKVLNAVGDLFAKLHDTYHCDSQLFSFEIYSEIYIEYIYMKYI